MKKILLSFAITFATCCMFVACGSDDDSGMTFTTTPEEQAVGTYDGTFTRDYTDLEGVEHHDEATGTLVFTANTTYVSDIEFTCSSLELSANSVANISHANKDLVFYNNNTSNGLGGRFTGRIINDESVKLTFNTEIEVKRMIGKREKKDRLVSYWSFTGNKQHSQTTD